MQSEDGIRIIRAWTDIDSTDVLLALAGADSTNQTIVGTIKVPTRCLAIFWAPESGEMIPERMDGDVQKVRGTAIESSSYVMMVENEIYACLHDQVELGDGQAIRLTLRPVQKE